MAASIRVLPPDLARLIAAGEVVSRPLDVVRELVENALDAGASRVEVELEGGGLTLIRVRDNGAGIPAAEVPLAPLRHATSKLEALERVTTLGFRGEALWAIAQAGELHLVTRPSAQVGATELTARGDEVSHRRTTAPAGTTVTVRRLFEHLPARLRTQNTHAAEARDVQTMLGRYALHRPHLAFRLTVDREVRLTHAPSDHRGAVASVYGPLSANRVLALEADGLRGVVSRPELTRPRRDRMHFSVNGRPVQGTPELERAVIAGYAELLPGGHAPLCVLDLTVPPEDVNPNVHPTKSVVALAEPAVLAARITAAVQGALATQPLSRAAPALRVAEPPAPQPLNRFPQLELVGVYGALYLLAEGEGDLWVIDGHAAAERVWYERLERAFVEAVPLDLPEPELLQLSPEQAAHLRERDADLRAFGLTLEDFGAGLARLRSLPAALAALPVPRLHEQVVEAALDGAPDPRRSVLARLACAPALKAGMIGLENGAALLADLTACGQPWSCPHGRPTVLRLSERDLAHAFGRRGMRDVARGRDLTAPPVPVPDDQPS